MPLDLEKLKQDLIRDEGIRLSYYRCPAGKLTLGVGRNMSALGWTEEQLKALCPISREDALAWLDEDMTRAIGKTEAMFYPDFYDLTETRKRVLINMYFCLGDRLRGFKRLRQAIQVGDYSWAAQEILDSKFAAQTGLRAKRLAKMMLEG